MQGSATQKLRNESTFGGIPLLSTIKQFCARHHAFTNGGIRHLIFHSDSNGLASSGVIVRNGRRILINEEKFFRWLEERG